MPRSPRHGLTLALARIAVGPALLVGCGGGLCEPAALEGALAGAGPGDVVEIGACRLSGAFVVPDGVILSGQSGSVLASASDVAVVETRGSGTVRGLRVEVDHGGVGVLTRGGTLGLTDVVVVVTRGIAVGVDAGSLTATRVTLDGPITEEDAAFASMSPDETATFGLVARGLDPDDSITLTDVRVTDFAVAGLSIGGGSLLWRGRDAGPDVEGVRGVGIALFGTTASLESVEVAAMRSGVGMPGIGVVASGLGGVATELTAEVRVHDGDGYGLFADASAVTLAGSEFADLGLMGVRLQGGSLSATDLVAERNGGAGLMAIDTTSVSVERGRLDAQREAVFVTTLGSVRVADGIQVVRDPESAAAPPLDLQLVDVTLSGNARAGLLLDANDGAVARLRLEGLAVEASGAGYGAVTQRTAVGAGWDAMVTRAGAAAANDAAFSSAIDVVGIMMPPGLVATPPSL